MVSNFGSPPCKIIKNEMQHLCPASSRNEIFPSSARRLSVQKSSVPFSRVLGLSGRARERDQVIPMLSLDDEYLFCTE